MQKIKLTLILVLVICLNGCGSIPTLNVSQRIYDFKNHRCLERNYQYSAEYIGPRGATIEVPIEKCDLLIGYDPDNYVKVYEWIDGRRKDFSNIKDAFKK